MTSIGGYAFRNCSGLTSVNYLGTIDQWAEIIFSDYSANPLSYAKKLYINNDLVTEVNLTTATKISGYAFYGCSGLTSVKIGNDVTSIGYSAFENCSGLTSVKIGNGVTSIGYEAFSYCSRLTSVTIGNSVTWIDSYAFYGCSGLTSVTIGNSVTSIGQYAFSGCSGLKNIYYTGSVANWCTISGLNNIMQYSRSLYIDGKKIEGELVIPDSVTSIGDSAFRGCSGLTSVKIGNGVTSIGYEAFDYCSGLKNIYYTGSVANWCTISGLNNIMQYLGSLYIDGKKIEGELVIPDSVTSIGGDAFRGCTGLTNVTIGNSVESIGLGAFRGCSGLTSVTIGNSVTSIGSQAFMNCRGLTSVTIPDSVTSIGNYAFSGCSGLTSVTIPDSVTSIGDYAFSGCSGLTSVTIPDSVTSIGDLAFDGCSGLTSVTIPDSVTSVGACAFRGCSGLTCVTIGNRVTSIGWGAFSGCSGLTSVTIGSGVTSIGNEAFYGCYKLVEVINKSRLNITKGNSNNGYIAYYALNVKKDRISDIVNKDGYLFYTYDNVNYLLAYVGSNTDLTLPDDYNGQNYELNNYAFYGCSGLTSVKIGNSVTSIGDWAFSHCSGLTSVTIPDSVTSIGYEAFSYCSRLKTVFYKGTAEQWRKISIASSNNDSLANATRYYYSETEPALNAEGTAYDGNYWHYDTDGITPVIWKKEN